MKKLILGLMATAALGISVPAAALAHGNETGYGYGQSDWGYGAYGEFSDDVDHVQQGIEHGLSDGSFSRAEARQFSRELRKIKRMIAYYYRDGGFSPWERSYIQQRLDNLHAVMHEAHDEGHEQQDYGYYNRPY